MYIYNIKLVISNSKAYLKVDNLVVSHDRHPNHDDQEAALHQVPDLVHLVNVRIVTAVVHDHDNDDTDDGGDQDEHTDD